jgi:aspartyl protease family protein
MAIPDPERNQTTGKPLFWLAGLGMLAALIALFQALGPGRGGIVETIDEPGRRAVVVERDPSGHFLAEGEINGTSVLFLIDTGATDVALPKSLARKLGLEFGPQVTVVTAAGPMAAWMTRLDRVTVGGITLTNVRGTITQGPLNEALLGMSFLRHFRLTQQDDRLVIESSR